MDFALKSSDWNQTFLAYTIAEELLPDDKINIYIWNNSHQSFATDDFNIEQYLLPAINN